MRSSHICIVSHAAYGALTEASSGHVGGVERQTTLLARWLAARGHAVDLIVWRETHEDVQFIEGIRVLTVCRQDDGWPGVRFLHPRWTSLIGALRRSGADVYYHNTAEYVTGQVALWCHLHDRRFVFSAASQADCDSTLPLLPTRRERLLYRLGLRHADAIVVQTFTQQQMMQSGFGLASEVIPMPCPEPDPAHILAPDACPLSARVLWVGRICPEKRPELLLDTVERALDLQFDVVGPTDGTAYASAIVARLERCANVVYHGAVQRSRMPEMFGRTGCLVCTSHIEGFPNTFLEAWSQGVPVVSTWDPDDLIKKRQLGIACTPTAAGVVEGLRVLLRSPDMWSRASANARAYYLSAHRPDLTFTAMEAVLVGAPRPPVVATITAASAS